MNLVAYTHVPGTSTAAVHHVICVPCQLSWPSERAGEAVDHDTAIHGCVVPDYPPAS